MHSGNTRDRHIVAGDEKGGRAVGGAHQLLRFVKANLSRPFAIDDPFGVDGQIVAAHRLFVGVEPTGIDDLAVRVAERTDERDLFMPVVN